MLLLKYQCPVQQDSATRQQFQSRLLQKKWKYPTNLADSEELAIQIESYA